MIALQAAVIHAKFLKPCLLPVVWELEEVAAWEVVWEAAWEAEMTWSR